MGDRHPDLFVSILIYNYSVYVSGLGMLQRSYPSVEFVLPGRERDSTCKRHLACAGHHEGLLHILWDCLGVSKMWAYSKPQWTRTEISPAQMVLYKQAALSRSTPELYPSVREVIKQVVPDHADIIGRD